MAKGKVVVIGAGIIGQAHALTALEDGWSVTLLEKDGRPLGASVRNFGTLWPIGCVPGAEREQALFGLRRWKDLARKSGFWINAQGSLSLAYRPESLAVLQEFTRSCPAGDGFQLLDPAEILRRFPRVVSNGLRGGLYSPWESVVHPPQTMAALSQFLAKRGANVLFGAPVTRITSDAVEISDGRQFPFDQLVIAAGDDMRTFFPHELAGAGLTRCRLQMMRTQPQPPGFDLGAVFVSDLTLCHYPAFRDCPSTPALRDRVRAEMPGHIQHGVHVIAAQHPDGSIIIGDSHEYAADFDPDTRTDVDELIIDALQQFLAVPNGQIAAHWQGIYLKSTKGETQVVLHPRERVTMVTAMGGLGMTLSWGLAQKTIASWTA